MAGIAAAVMASTIFLSGSRGGMVAFLVQVGVLAIVVFWGQKSRTVTRALLPFLLIGVGLVVWLGGNELARRLETIHAETRAELSGGTRLDIDRDALHMFARRPILGWGMGVFPDVYPQFRSFHTNFFINEAHNDYLQLLVEMGGLGFATMLWFLWLAVSECRAQAATLAGRHQRGRGIGRNAGSDRNTGPQPGGLQPANSGQCRLVLCVLRGGCYGIEIRKDPAETVRRVSRVEEIPGPEYSRTRTARRTTRGNLRIGSGSRAQPN